MTTPSCKGSQKRRHYTSACRFLLLREERERRYGGALERYPLLPVISTDWQHRWQSAGNSAPRSKRRGMLTAGLGGIASRGRFLQGFRRRRPWGERFLLDTTPRAHRPRAAETAVSRRLGCALRLLVWNSAACRRRRGVNSGSAAPPCAWRCTSF